MLYIHSKYVSTYIKHMYYVRRGLVKYVPPGQSNLYKIASALIDFFYVK